MHNALNGMVSCTYVVERSGCQIQLTSVLIYPKLIAESREGLQDLGTKVRQANDASAYGIRNMIKRIAASWSRACQADGKGIMMTGSYTDVRE